MKRVAIYLCLSFFSACASVPQKEATQEGQIYGVAAAQFAVEANQTSEQFFNKVEELVRQAAIQKLNLIVLPELLVMDVWPLTSKMSEQERSQVLASQLTPKYFEKAIELSVQYQIAILAGSAPRWVGNQIFNTALLAFPDGRVVYQDKIFLTPWEIKQGWTSGKSIRVFDAPWGRSVILICFDSEYPLLSQMLAEAQPEWIFVPSMTESVEGLNRVRWSAQARAVEHHAFVVVAGTVGRPAADWIHHGQGVLLEPWDNGFKGVVREGELGRAGLVSGRFDMKKLRASRKASHFFPAKNQLGKRVLLEKLK